MEYIIRRVSKEDLAAVVQVEARCFPAAEAAGRERLEQRIEAFPECFFVAESGGSIIGMINGCATDENSIRDEMFEDSGLHQPDGRYQSIFGLDVLPEFRNKGVAKGLMRHLISHALKNGRKGLILTCKACLIPYYEKFGYVNCGVSKSTHGGAVWYDMILDCDGI